VAKELKWFDTVTPAAVKNMSETIIPNYGFLSVLLHCWLGDWKGIWPVKRCVGYLVVTI